MTRLGGADEIIIRVIHPRGQIAEILADAVGEGLWRDALVPCRLLHLLSMFIGAGEEHHLIAVQPLEPGQNIAGKRCVGMADMRLVIHIIDRRRDVETPIV